MRRNKFKARKFENLEERRMMAGDISFANGILTITGDSLDDVAVVRFEEDEVHVDLTVQESDGGTDDHDETEEIADVAKIVFNGFAGDDRLTVFVDELDQGVTLNNVVLEFNGEGNNDELIQNNGGIKTTALGGSGDDKLEGSRFDDILDGGANNDTYVFRGRNVGSDELREAANVGTDTLDFSGFETFVSVDLESVFSASNPDFAATAFMSNLRLKQLNATGIEDVIGSALTDTIRGNSRPNHFWGGGDNDKLAGRGGDDILEGQAGNDTYEFAGVNLGTDDVVEDANTGEDHLRFSGMTTGLTIDISKSGPAFAVNSANLKLRLSNESAIENVTGTQFGDSITGNSRDNTLRGVGGADAIRGLGGADTLEGGADNDVLFTDALDAAFGGIGRDFFDGFTEDPTRTNPSAARYRDWGLL